MVRILQVFNRYVHMGGEEKSVDRIYQHLGEEHQVARCFFESKDWARASALAIPGQLIKTFYNHGSRKKFEEVIKTFRPEVALFHNAFPVGSPSLYHAAARHRVPVIHYVHNFRPFSVGGTLYSNGQFLEEALGGDYRREVQTGAWQGSRLKSAVMARVLRRLHASGWLENVRAWVCISEFLRDKLAIGAGVESERLFALRHSWDAMKNPPPPDDRGYYLFLGRLVDVKGVEVLLEAWRQLRARLGPATPPLHIGGEGPLAERVKAEAARYPDIKYLGLVTGEAKHAAISGCRAMVAPSVWWEPLGLVTYEAYDYGKPMLAARSGGLSETVIAGLTGFLHEPGDAAGLAGDVLILQSMSLSERYHMGAEGRVWLLSECSPARWKASFGEVLAGIVAR